MAWARFQYLCRAALSKPSDEHLSDFIGRENSKSSAGLYGELSEYSFPHSLLEDVQCLKDEDRQLAALATYAKLDPTSLVDKPKNLRRMSIYMLWVIGMFLVAVSMYKIKIFPSFVEFYENFGARPSDETYFLIQHGPTIALLIGILLLALVLAAFLINRLILFKRDYSESSLLYFCPKFIKSRYLRLIALLRYPASEATELGVEANSEIFKHLSEAENIGMNLDEEICALFKSESAKLVRSCELAVKAINVIVSITVVYMLFQFVTGVYGPIFSLGEVI